MLAMKKKLMDNLKIILNFWNFNELTISEFKCKMYIKNNHD